jgi:transposase InsO family protein
MNIGQRRSRKIDALCSLLGYSRQSYYQRKVEEQKEVLEQELIIQQVVGIRARQKHVGARKLLYMLAPFLHSHNIQIGRDAFFDLLSVHGLLIRKRKRKIPRTTFSDHWMRKYPNLIVGMSVTGPNQLWVSDITYIMLEDKPAYLSLVTDAYSRMIVGYHLNKDLSAQGCIKALDMALKSLPEGVELIHHSDRGCQYCSFEYVERLVAYGVAISMTQNSDPRENAIAERVNGIIKREFLETCYPTLPQATAGVKTAVYIYNHERLHSSIDMLTPVEAHAMTGKLKKHWKNYYAINEKEVIMT